MEASRIYLDYNASAPLSGAAARAMAPWLEGSVCNPSSVHRSGQRARAAVEEARGRVAALLGVTPPAVVFTSGGTEADNAALWGALGWPPTGHVVISTIEHPAIQEPADALGELGIDITRIPVDKEGHVELDALEDALREDTRLVSVMTANNEVGTIQHIHRIAEIARRAGALFHTDAVQAAAWLDLHPIAQLADLVSISSHKLGGPPGVGALFVRPGLELTPLLRGGGQQGGRRGGTEATAAMVGFGAACERALRRRADAAAATAVRRDRLEGALLDGIDGAHRSGPRAGRLPNTCHLCFAGCDGNALVARLDVEGIAASAGAACASGVSHGSPVLEALGVPRALRAGALRLSLGYDTTDAEIERAAAVIPRAVVALRDAGVEAVR